MKFCEDDKKPPRGKMSKVMKELKKAAATTSHRVSAATAAPPSVAVRRREETAELAESLQAIRIAESKKPDVVTPLPVMSLVTDDDNNNMPNSPILFRGELNARLFTNLYRIYVDEINESVKIPIIDDDLLRAREFASDLQRDYTDQLLAVKGGVTDVDTLDKTQIYSIAIAAWQFRKHPAYMRQYLSIEKGAAKNLLFFCQNFPLQLATQALLDSLQNEK
jgi:hypothetical protein